MADDKRQILMNFAEGLNNGKNDEKQLSNAVEVMETLLEHLPDDCSIEMITEGLSRAEQWKSEVLDNIDSKHGKMLAIFTYSIELFNHFYSEDPFRYHLIMKFCNVILRMTAQSSMY